MVARRRWRLENLVQELTNEGCGSAEMIVADLTDPAAIRRIEDRIRDEPRLKLLVNNAGASSSGECFMETESETRRSMLSLHITAVMALTHAALGVMRRHRGGHSQRFVVSRVPALCKQRDLLFDESLGQHVYRGPRS
jgi:uncharacterized protein